MTSMVQWSMKISGSQSATTMESPLQSMAHGFKLYVISLMSTTISVRDGFNPWLKISVRLLQ